MCRDLGTGAQAAPGAALAPGLPLSVQPRRLSRAAAFGDPPVRDRRPRPVPLAVRVLAGEGRARRSCPRPGAEARGAESAIC